MENSSVQHHQAMGADQTLENMLVCPKTSQQQDRKPRPQPEQALKCPRCDSTNTKFCYYNNYSLSQPRYFCKSCRRYWTKGGTLRNVPVGGGCRKNRRSSSSSKHGQEHHNQHMIIHNNNHPLATALSLPSLEYDHHHSNDLSLAFARLQKQSSAQFGFENHDFPILGGGGGGGMNPNIGDTLGNNSGFFESLRSNGFLDTQGNSNFHSLYYGLGGNNGSTIGEGENRGREIGVSYDEMGGGAGSSGTTSAVTITTMKQEPCSTSVESDNKVLWGFPWQMNNNNNNNMEANYAGDFDNSTRGSNWNGLNYSSWHGLINSPLM